MNNKLISILREVAEIEDLSLNPETKIFLEYGFDSLQTMTFILELEEKFQLRLDLDTFDIDITLGDLEKIVEKSIQDIP